MCCAFVVSLLKLALQIACYPLGFLLVASTPIQAAPVGCLTGRLYPSFGLPTPAEWTHSVSYWQPIPLSASRCSLRSSVARASYHPIRPRAHPPSGFAAGRRGRRSLRIAVFVVFDCSTFGSKSRAGGATPCAGRNPSLRSVASALAPHPSGVLLAAFTP